MENMYAVAICRDCPQWRGVLWMDGLPVDEKQHVEANLTPGGAVAQQLEAVTRCAANSILLFERHKRYGGKDETTKSAYHLLLWLLALVLITRATDGQAIRAMGSVVDVEEAWCRLPLVVHAWRWADCLQNVGRGSKLK